MLGTTLFNSFLLVIVSYYFYNLFYRLANLKWMLYIKNLKPVNQFKKDN